MKKLLFTALLAAYGIIAHAAPYPSHDLSKLIQHNELNIQLVDNVLSDLDSVAGNYPPRFDNDADQLRAIAEAGQLNRFLQGVIDVKAVTPKQTTEYVNILYRLARINAMAHNMDVPDAAPIADGYFQKIIAQLKNKPKEKARIQGEYGAFLVSSNRVNHAIPLLQQAIIRRGYQRAFAVGHRLFNAGQQSRSGETAANPSKTFSARRTLARRVASD